MNAPVHLILIILALVCFLVAAIDIRWPSRLIAAGLFLWLLATLVSG